MAWRREIMSGREMGKEKRKVKGIQREVGSLRGNKTGRKGQGEGLRGSSFVRKER